MRHSLVIHGSTPDAHTTANIAVRWAHWQSRLQSFILYQSPKSTRLPDVLTVPIVLAVLAVLAVLSVLFVLGSPPTACGAEPPFHGQELATQLDVGYAVRLLDMNRDGRIDIAIVDSNRILWLENPAGMSTSSLPTRTRPRTSVSRRTTSMVMATWILL
jgi:hypothetical protein